MVVLNGLNSGDLFAGLADNVLFKCLCLSVPLGYRVAVGDHAVIIAELHLGLELSRGVDSAFGDIHLALRAVDTAGNYLTLSVENNGCDGSVDLSIAGLGRIHVEGNAHAESVLTAGSGSFGSCIGSGSLGRRIGCGSLSGCGRSGLTAGSQRENHAKCKNKCKDLFHICLHIF